MTSMKERNHYLIYWFRRSAYYLNGSFSETFDTGRNSLSLTYLTAEVRVFI